MIFIILKSWLIGGKVNEIEVIYLIFVEKFQNGFIF